MTNIAKGAGSATAAMLGCCALLINVFGGIVAGIWLLAMGEWKLVVLGFLLSMLMPTCFAIASLPAMGIAAVLLRSHGGPSRPAMAIGGFLIAGWNAAMLGSWCVFVFFLFEARIQQGTAIPLLLWSYATTMAPLAYMASKESPPTDGTSLGLLLAVAIFIALLISHLVGGSWVTAVAVAAVLGLAEAVVLASLGVMMTPRQPEE